MGVRIGEWLSVNQAVVAAVLLLGPPACMLTGLPWSWLNCLALVIYLVSPPHTCLTFAACLVRATATDRETGRSRGFAHVEFASGDAAAKAVAMNGQLDMDGRTLKLDLSEGRSAATPGSQRGGFNNAGASDGTTVFVKGFDTSGGWEGLQISRLSVSVTHIPPAAGTSR